MPRLLLTGASGFVGHHCLEHLMVNTDWQVIATDSFRHKGKFDRLREISEPRPEWRQRIEVLPHDLAAPFTAQTADRIGHVDYVIAMASESHVDRSIADPVPFVLNNVNVILNTLELARYLQPEHVIVISTDEVYGPVGIRLAGVPDPEPGRTPGAVAVTERLGMHPEWSAIIPSNPYSASKAAQEACAVAWWRSYGVPVTIVNCMNLYGQRQSPEKYLPMLIGHIAAGKPVTIHGTPGNIGTRHYLHARNLSDALVHILRELPPAAFQASGAWCRRCAGEGSGCWCAEPEWVNVADRPNRWNIAGPEPISNLDLAQQVAAIIGKPLRFELVDFHSARPGHDPHYGLDPAKLEAAGWKPPVSFAESLEHTVHWTLAHPAWLRED